MMKAENIHQFRATRPAMTIPDALAAGAALSVLAMLLILGTAMEQQRQHNMETLRMEREYADRAYDAGYAAGLAAGVGRREATEVTE